MRWLRWSAAALALGLAIAGGGVAWLVRSEGGTVWLLGHVPGLTVHASTGRLLDGPFGAQRIELKLGTRLLTVDGLTWQDAQWSSRPHAGAWIGLVLASPRATRVTLVRGSETSQPALTPPSSLRLPFELTLQGAHIDTLSIEGLLPITQLSGTASLGAREGAEHNVTDLVFDWDRSHVQASGTLASDRPFAVQLQVKARSRDDTAPAWQAEATARGPLDRFVVQASLGSAKAPGATLRADASVLPFATWPLGTLEAAVSELDLATLGSGLPTTHLSGRAAFDTRGLDAPIAARVALTNARPGRWDQQRLPIAVLDLDLSGRPNDRARVKVDRFAMQLAEGGGRIDGSGEWHGTQAQLALRLQGVRPALLDARAAAMTLSGSSSLDLGGLPSPDGAIAPAPRQTLQARLALDGRMEARAALPVALGARVDAERGSGSWRVDLHDLTLRNADARAQGTLSAEHRADGWRLRSSGELIGFDPSLWFPGASDSAWRKGPHRLAGRWQADLQGDPGVATTKAIEARLLALRGEAQLQLQDSLVAGLPLQAAIKLAGRTPGWVADGELQVAGNRATLQGRMAPRGEDDRWQVNIDAPALTALQPLLSLHPGLAAALRGSPPSPLAGQLGGQVRGQGRWPALSIDADLRASALQAAGLRAARLQLKARGGPDANAALAVQLDAEQLVWDGLRADTLQLRADGSLAEHRVALDLQSPVRPPAWADPLLGGKPGGTRIVATTRGQWLATDPRQGLLPGRWQTLALELVARGRDAAATTAWLSARDLRLQLQLGADARVLQVQAEPGRIELLGAALRWSEARWQAGLANQADEASLDAQLEPLVLAPWLKKLRPGPELSGNLTIAGRARVQIGQRVTADVVLERTGGDLTLTDEIGTTAFGLTDLRLAIDAQEGTWHFTQALAGSNVGVLAGAQSLRLPQRARWPPADTPMQGVLEWQVADLAAWAPFTPAGWRLSGTLRTGAAIGGTFGAPEITGQMNGSRLAVRNLLMGVDLRDGDLALSLRGSQAAVDRFVFKGGAGELRLTGGAQLGADPSANLQLRAERFQVLGRFDRRITASGTAALALSRQALSLDGRVHIDDGLIDFSRGDAPSLDSDVQVRGASQAPASAPPAGADDAPAASNGAPRSTRVALQVDLGDELKIRGRGLDTRLRGNLALSTPDGRLAVKGAVRTEAGSYAAYGQKLAIERGVLAFDGPAENPRLDIVAVRPNLDLRVGVQVSGSAQLPRVRLFSEPEMTDTDKLSWLVLGRAPDGLARTDTALLQRAALALLAGEGEGLDRTLLANIGLDDFSVRQIEAGEVRDTVVTLGKQLSRRWYAGYERGVNSTTGTWQLIYRAAQRLTVRAQAGEDNAVDAIWTWRWN